MNSPESTLSVVLGAMALRPGGSGVQTYERELLNATAMRLEGKVKLSATVQRDTVGELPDGVAPIPRPVGGGVKRALHGLQPVRGADLFHSLDVDLPLGQGGALVATVHDMSVFDTPWAMSRVRARGEQVLLRRSLQKADELIAVSAFTAQRIEALLKRTAHVIPLAPASWARIPGDNEVGEVRRKYGLPERFVFQLGTLEPRKRPDVPAVAAAKLGIPMVVAGAGTDGPLPFPARGLGYVDREDIPALYRAASVVCYASVYEGFGLPPVEAMACGAVVVASDVGGIREAVGDGARLVGNLSEDAWVTALKESVLDRSFRQSLRDAASYRCAELTWGSVAERTIAVYGRLLSL